MTNRPLLAAIVTVAALATPTLAQSTATSQPYTWRSATVKANGFIDGIVFSPTVAGLVYIHTDMGGAYRYDTDKSRWTPLNDWSRWTDSAAKSMGTETLAVDPTDPDRVYLGIGTYMQPSAVLRSGDRGKTWQRTDVPFEMNGNGSGRNTGERMRVDPNSPNVLYYGTRDDGLFKSVDHGATWQNVKSFPTIGHDEGWGKDTGILFVEFDKTSGAQGAPTKTIYVGVFEPTAGKPRLFRSRDAGETWQPIAGDQPTTANLFPQRAALTSDGKTLYLTYATSTVYPGPYGLSDGAVYKVTDPAGDKPTWTKVTPPAKYAYSAIAIDPTDPNTVYAGEMGDYNPADRIWRSTDGAKTWKVITPNAHRDDSSAPYAKDSKVHWLGDLQIDPKNRDVAMFTTGYGLYRTTNLTADEPKWSFFNDGFEQSAVLEIASPTGGPVNLITAIGDRDGYRHVDLDVSPADGLLGQNNGMARGTSTDIDVAWNDPNRLVRLVRAKPFVQTSRDNGVTWTWLDEALAAGANEGSLAISNDGTRVVYAAASGERRDRAAGNGAGADDAGLYVATRDGEKWSAFKKAAGDAGGVGRGVRVLVDLGKGDTFYATSGRSLRTSTDGGATWKTVGEAALPDGADWVRSIPGHAGHLLCAAGDHGAYRSTDGGATWHQLAAGTVTHANQAGVGVGTSPESYPSLFVAGSANGTTGFFRSDDEGKTWVTISDDAHQFGAPIVIQGDSRIHGRLYVGTNGRGTLVGDPAK